MDPIIIDLNDWQNGAEFVDRRKVGRTKMPEEEAQRRIKESQQNYYMRNREAILARAKQRYAEKKAQGLLPTKSKSYKKMVNPVEERMKETEAKVKELEAIINRFNATQISPTRDIPSCISQQQAIV